MLALLAILPVVVIFLLLVLKKTPADIAGSIGWIVTFAVAWLFFKTPAIVILQSSLAGLVASLPIALVVATSILQITIMIESGAIARIVALVKTISPGNQAIQIMVINVGFGTLLAALGAVPVSILPPIMIAMGYSSFAAIALPAIGYDALCTYALLGVPVVVFSGFIGASVQEVGIYFARYMPFISTSIAIGMLWIVGRWKLVKAGLLPAVVTGLTAGLICIAMNLAGLVTITGIAAGVGVMLIMLLYLKIIRQPVISRAVLNENDIQVEKKINLAAALSPWLILTFFSLLVNAPFLPFFNLTFNRFSMPLEIIPGAPEKVRVFWQAYFWILVSTVAALPFLRPSPDQLKVTLKKWMKRFPRPTYTAAIFFAIAFIINHSGKTMDWQLLVPQQNMVYVLANGAAAVFGMAYPFIAPFLGLLGGFISGSETSSIAMLTALHLSTAEKIGALGVLVAAASGIGGGLASVISPAKLQNAAAAIDRIGEETKVIPTTFVISLVITAVCGLLTLFWAFR